MEELRLLVAIGSAGIVGYLMGFYWAKRHLVDKQSKHPKPGTSQTN